MRNCILVQLIDLGVDFESKLLISVEYLLANAEAFRDAIRQGVPLSLLEVYFGFL